MPHEISYFWVGRDEVRGTVHVDDSKAVYAVISRTQPYNWTRISEDELWPLLDESKRNGYRIVGRMFSEQVTAE